MSLTVADVERDLVDIHGAYLSRTGRDATTADGTNPSLRIPIRRAAKRLGLAVAGGAVTDAELIPLDPASEETFLDVALYHSLKACRGSWAEFDQSDGEDSQSLSQLTKALDDWIRALEEELGPLAVDEDSSTLARPPAHGLLRAGLCYPPHGANRWGLVSGGYCEGRFYG